MPRAPRSLDKQGQHRDLQEGNTIGQEETSSSPFSPFTDKKMRPSKEGIGLGSRAKKVVQPDLDLRSLGSGLSV